MTVEDNIAPALVERLAATARYRERRRAIRAWNRASPIVKRGIALTPVKFGISFTATHYNQAGALVHVYSDGTVLLNHGGTEMGQGLFTKVRQVVARELGVALEAVRVSASDTSKVPNASPTAASSGSDLNGMAARDACRKLRANLATFAARKLGGEPEAVAFHHGAVAAGGKSLTFAELARAAYFARVPLSATGFYATPKVHYDRATLSGRPFLYFAYGAAVCEVAVDTLHGEHRLLAIVADGHVAARRRLEMRRREARDPALQIMRHKRQQSGAQCRRIDSRKRGLAGQVGQQPFVEAPDKLRIRKVGPGRAEPAMQELQPMAQRLGLLVPGQQGKPVLSDRRQDRPVGVFAARRGQHLLGQGDRAEPHGLARPNRAPCGVEGAFDRAFDAMRQCGADGFLRNRGGRGDARALRLAREVGNHEEAFDGQRVGSVELCAAAVGHHEAATLAACLCDPVGPCRKQQGAGTGIPGLPGARRAFR